jgi:hypothetical protein
MATNTRNAFSSIFSTLVGAWEERFRRLTEISIPRLMEICHRPVKRPLGGRPFHQYAAEPGGTFVLLLSGKDDGIMFLRF